MHNNQINPNKFVALGAHCAIVGNCSCRSIFFMVCPAYSAYPAYVYGMFTGETFTISKLWRLYISKMYIYKCRFHGECQFPALSEIQHET